jgi:hypothetical protein
VGVLTGEVSGGEGRRGGKKGLGFVGKGPRRRSTRLASGFLGHRRHFYSRGTLRLSVTMELYIFLYDLYIQVVFR